MGIDENPRLHSLLLCEHLLRHHKPGYIDESKQIMRERAKYGCRKSNLPAVLVLLMRSSSSLSSCRLFSQRERLWKSRKPKSLRLSDKIRGLPQPETTLPPKKVPWPINATSPHDLPAASPNFESHFFFSFVLNSFLGIKQACDHSVSSRYETCSKMQPWNGEGLPIRDSSRWRTARNPWIPFFETQV